MTPIDPHSFIDSTHPLTTHVSLSLYLDFNTQIIHASALLTLSAPFSGDLSLDSRCISIDTILDPQTLNPLPYSVSPTPDRIRGTEIVVVLSGQSSVLIVYSTSPSASALQWLTPLQTFSKTHPYVYTQCQAIHARSIFPCQDSPAARIRYDVVMNIPTSLSAVMSARHVRRRVPNPEEAKHLEAGSLGSSLWDGEDRVVEEFAMEQPIPPYLFAFAVGELGFREVGPRTRVYGESAAVEVLDAAALEFAGTEEVIKQGEMLSNCPRHQISRSPLWSVLGASSLFHFAFRSFIPTNC